MRKRISCGYNSQFIDHSNFRSTRKIFVVIKRSNLRQIRDKQLLRMRIHRVNLLIFSLLACFFMIYHVSQGQPGVDADVDFALTRISRSPRWSMIRPPPPPARSPSSSSPCRFPHDACCHIQDRQQQLKCEEQGDHIG